MKNDPLLSSTTPPPPPPGASRSAASHTSRRRPKPATSAKILATGLSTTAMLGMTAGYAFAGQNDTPAPQPTPSTPASLSGPVAPGTARTSDTTVTPQIAPLSTEPAVSGSALPNTAPATPSVIAPAAPAAPVASVPDTTAAPVIIDVPVPATPGNGGGNWNSQQSSGSH